MDTNVDDFMELDTMYNGPQAGFMEMDNMYGKYKTITLFNNSNKIYRQEMQKR